MLEGVLRSHDHSSVMLNFNPKDYANGWLGSYKVGGLDGQKGFL